MVDTDEEQMVEDGAHVGWPVQEEFKEDLWHQEQAGFNAEIYREELVVIVDQKQHLTCIPQQIPIEKAASP